MPQTLDEKLEEARQKDKLAKAMEAINDLQDEGYNVFGSGGEEKKPSGFERSTVSTMDGMHGYDAKKPEVTELHSVYPRNVLASALEMHIIHKAAKVEQDMMKKEHTVSKNQEEMNEVYVQIMNEGCEHLDRELAALEGSRAKDANVNISSLSAAELALNPPGMPMMQPQPGLYGRFKNWVNGKK